MKIALLNVNFYISITYTLTYVKLLCLLSIIYECL
jgi:hypothetical protein